MMKWIMAPLAVLGLVACGNTYKGNEQKVTDCIERGGIPSFTQTRDGSNVAHYYGCSLPRG